LSAYATKKGRSLAQANQYPSSSVNIETFYLSTGERVPVPPKNDAKHFQAYADAIAAIELGDFHPEPDPRRCPNCQCYFMCGT
jgi:DNA helicase II / ATP-dependent DNA helicase PcrA